MTSKTMISSHDDNDEDESTYRHVKKKNKAINIGESVLGQCPVCGCDVHRVLLQEHVEFCLTGKHRMRDEKENAKTLRDRTNYDEPHREEENEKRKKKKKKKPNAQFSILKFLQITTRTIIITITIAITTTLVSMMPK